jgi:uridylate kinase
MSSSTSSRIIVASLGGSIVAPDGVDTDFVRRFAAVVLRRVSAPDSPKLALIVGGGATARAYQAATRRIVPEVASSDLDLVGIAATRINAAVMKAVFGDACKDPVVTDPTAVRGITGSILVGGGWKPGFSTDNVAVRLAEALGSDRLLNLSNISQIYTADPSEDPSATPLSQMTWTELLEITGTEWVPGKNTPFDPVAVVRAAELHMTVITADGRDLDNLEKILDGKPFVGTTVSD